MEKKILGSFPHVQPNEKITKDMRNKATEIVKNAKKMGKIKSHVEAFDKYPVKDEIHQGKENYYF